MTTVAAAIVSGTFALIAGCVVAWFNGQLRDIRGELDVCQRDRRQLRSLVQLIAGAIVGMLPEPERLTLLRRIDEAIPVDEAA